MEWISVKERLPEDDIPVWIYWKDREVLIGQYSYQGEDRNLDFSSTDDYSLGFYSFEDNKCRAVKWWMPITNKPMPPSKNKE